MKWVIKMFTPQSMIGKFGLWAAFFFAGMYTSDQLRDPCPPTMRIDKIKSKGKSTLSSTITPADCETWLRGMSNKEIKAIRKER